MKRIFIELSNIVLSFAIVWLLVLCIDHSMNIPNLRVNNASFMEIYFPIIGWGLLCYGIGFLIAFLNNKFCPTENIE